MITYIFQMVTSPSQLLTDCDSGEQLRLSEWREDIIEITAINESVAKSLAAYQGLKENVHYNDILEIKGVIQIL